MKSEFSEASGNVTIQIVMNFRACLSIVILLLFLFYGIGSVIAAEFSEAFVRLDRMKANTPLSGLICAKPSSAGAGTEAKVAVTFPSGFTVNTTAGNWTTGTTNIPAGSTPWPGIGSSASGISGRTVTFASNNLTSSVRYCFTFTGSSSTTGSAENAEGSLTTRESDNTLVDATTIGFLVINNDEVTLHATVPAQPNDFDASLTQITAGTTFAQDETIEYEITYGSSVNYNTSITVEASWSLGTIQGSGIPSDDTLSYVIGSASDGYGAASPIIDPVNRKITWTIPVFPGNTANQTVTFRLQTTGNYTGPLPVDFTVSGRVLGPGTATQYSTVAGVYQFTAAPTQTPTPTPAATPTSAPGPTATPGPGTTITPTDIPGSTAPLSINTISIRTIAATEATIALTTSQPTTSTIAYGTSQSNLNQRVNDLSLKAVRRIDLSTLTPDTQYYFRITVTDGLGQQITSDLYTFTTAKESIVPRIELPSLIMTSHDIIVFSPLDNATAQNTVVLPKDSTYELQFTLTDRALIKSVRLFTRDRNVLGITTKAFATEAVGSSVIMLEVKPGVFTGRLKTPIPGNYELYSRVEDFNGNIAEQKVVNLKAVNPLTILEKDTNQPIEHAKITLYIYNAQSKIYELITQQALSIQNPSYSEPDGIVPLVLPQAQYRAEIDNLRNEKKIVDFIIGPHSGQDYPTVYLIKAPFSLGKTVSYIIGTCADTISSLHEFLERLGSSGRFLELNALAILSCFVILSTLALAARLRISIFQLPWYLGQLLHHHAERDKQSIFKGKVLDHDSGKPIAGADIFLIDSVNGKIILHTISNASGAFRFPMLPVFSYRMEIAKATYHSGHFTIHEIEEKEQLFSIVQHSPLLNLKFRMSIFAESLASMSFELLLLASFVLSILLGISFGFLKIFPFLILAVVNMFFWMAHLRHNAFYEQS